MKEKKNNETSKRSSRYNPNRNSYITEDGRYAYVVWDGESKCNITHYIETGKGGVTEEILILLDEDDHQMDLQERYGSENADYGFLNRQLHHIEDSEKFAIDPIGNIEDKQADLFTVLFTEEVVPNKLMPQLLEIMDNLTDAQRDLIYDHLGAMKQLEEIRQDEIAATGKQVTQQAVSNRWKKIITVSAKSLTLLFLRNERLKQRNK